MNKHSIVEQIRENTVAIASLVVAIAALAHASWHYSHMEHNQNIRVAAFEVLLNLGQLQQVVNTAYYDPKNSFPLAGWGNVALISDLSELIPDPVPQAAKRMIDTWKENYPSLQKDEAAVEKISLGIDETRASILNVLHHLD